MWTLLTARSCSLCLSLKNECSSRTAIWLLCATELHWHYSESSTDMFPYYYKPCNVSTVEPQGTGVISECLQKIFIQRPSLPYTHIWTYIAACSTCFIFHHIRGRKSLVSDNGPAVRASPCLGRWYAPVGDSRCWNVMCVSVYLVYLLVRRCTECGNTFPVWTMKTLCICLEAHI